MYDLDHVDNLAKKYYEEILIDLGFDLEQDGTIFCPCPIHGGDNPKGFSFDPQIKRWRCWTNHCHEEYGTGLVGLIRSLKECSLPEAIDYIYNLTGENKKYQSDDLDITSRKYIRKVRKKEVAHPEVKIYEESILDSIQIGSPYFLSRGISEDTIRTFQCFEPQNPKKLLNGYAAFPLRNFEHKIVGFGGRRKDNSNRPKWLYSCKLNNCFFGLMQALPYILESKTCILVEGPLDAMKLWTYGIKNVISTLSNKITKKQKEFLLKLNISNLIIAMDPDEGGDIGAANIHRQCKLFFNIVDIHNNLTTDPGDLSEKEIQEIFGAYSC